jgi:hypothetical protein
VITVAAGEVGNLFQGVRLFIDNSFLPSDMCIIREELQ